MFRYAFVVLAVFVTVSLAGPGFASVADNQPPSAAPTNAVAHKKPAPDKRWANDEDGLGLQLSAMLGMFEIVNHPKKLMSNMIRYFVRTVRAMDARMLLKNTMITALVTGTGALAAMSVTGLVSMVSAICVVLPYIRIIQPGEAVNTESQTTMLNDLVMLVIDKYNKQINV